MLSFCNTGSCFQCFHRISNLILCKLNSKEERIILKKLFVLASSLFIVFISIQMFEVSNSISPISFQSRNGSAFAYPPAVGMLSDARNCLTCHVNNGPWRDDEKTIIDILDKETKKSLKQSDGSFLIAARRNENKTVLTVIGSTKDNSIEKPYRNAWLYIDTSMIEQNTLSKFSSGWEVNLQMACRLVGDKLPGFEDADITSLPMTIKPLGTAEDSELQLQVMLTSGESAKGDPTKGMLGNYYERKVILKILE